MVGLAAPFVLGLAIGHSLKAGLTALLWGGAVRILVLHHVTYSINSLCHYFGRKRFSTGDESRNLLWLSLPSLGEAWHNNHHAFPTSAAHGLRRWELDPSALVIRGLEKLGLAWNVVRVSPERQDLKAFAGAEPDAVRAYRSLPRGARPLLSRAALRSGVLGRHATSGHPVNGGGPDFTCARRRPWRTRCARRASSASGGRTCRACSRSTTSTPRSKLLDTWQPPPLPKADRARLAVSAVRAVGLTRPPAPPPVGAAPARQAPQP